MKKNLVYLVLVCFAVISVSGCGTAQKKRDAEVKGIKAKVETLETKVDTIETKQAEAEKTPAISEAPVSTSFDESTNVEVKNTSCRSKASTRDIQAALKNAGYYNGKVDGVKGKQTKKAIKEFQKANGLKADGIVGSRTWELLSKHAGGSGESVK
jgi:peptidoglycan hydrolase-like protein with peptidoglycan-binding domain